MIGKRIFGVVSVGRLVLGGRLFLGMADSMYYKDLAIAWLMVLVAELRHC